MEPRMATKSLWRPEMLYLTYDLRFFFFFALCQFAKICLSVWSGTYRTATFKSLQKYQKVSVVISLKLLLYNYREKRRYSMTWGDHQYLPLCVETSSLFVPLMWYINMWLTLSTAGFHFGQCTHELPCPKLIKRPVVPCNFTQFYYSLPLSRVSSKHSSSWLFELFVMNNWISVL